MDEIETSSKEIEECGAAEDREDGKGCESDHLSAQF
jgi:hypothetical protein